MAQGADPTDLTDPTNPHAAQMAAALTTPTPATPTRAAVFAEPLGEPSMDVQAALASLKRAGQLLPAWERGGIANFAEALRRLDGLALTTEMDAVGKTPWQWFVEFLGGLPRQIAFGELVGDDPESMRLDGADWTAGVPTAAPRTPLCPRSVELHRDTVRYMSDHEGVSYAEALRQVARG